METGDASGLAPGAPALGSGLSALRRSPGTCLPGGAGQAEVKGPGYRSGRQPRVHIEGTKAVESTSAKRLRGPARTARMSEARPENAVNGVFRAEALYLPGRQKLLGCFVRAALPVVAGGATTTTVALTAAIIWVLGNNFPPRARRPRKQFTTSGWLSVTLSSGRQGYLRCGQFGSGQCVRPLQDSRCSRRLVSGFSLASRPGVFGQPATAACWWDREVSRQELSP